MTMNSDAVLSDQRAEALTIADHELLRPIAAGSYGEVWLARNAVGTLRAVKIVRRARFERAEDFEREFKGMQRFEPVSRGHEGLVDILQIGRSDDASWFYYVMELADSTSNQCSVNQYSVNATLPTAHTTPRPLTTDSLITDYSPRTLRCDLKTRGALTAEEVITLGLTLASALAHLHAQGLVHRDVKPSNILFVGGVPKLADAGLVAAIDDARSLVGTTGYIAPEGPGTPQADIFALGKVLYEAAFGKDRQDFPQLPSDFASRPEHARLLELNEVIAKACAHDTLERYQSAEEMRADLELLQRGESVKQKRTRERRWSVVKRICIPAALLLLTAAALVTLVRNNTSREASNHSNRRSKIQLANKEYDEGVRCSSRDNREGLAQGLAYFNSAIEIDPNFTMAYAGLFEVYIGGKELGLSPAEMWAQLRAIASKLVELDSTLAEAQAAQAWIEFLDWKWDKAEPRFLRAIQLNPKCAVAHMRYGFCLVFSGRADEGQKELLIAEDIDPILPKIKKNLGHVFYVKRQFREAIEQYQKAIDLEPSYTVAHESIGYAYRALGNYTNSFDEFEKYELRIGKDPGQVRKHFDELRRAYKKGGPRGYWLKCLEEARQSADLYSQAACYARLKNYDKSLGLLQTLYATNRPGLFPNLYWDDCWDPVHDDPRFIALLQKVGLKK
jgi:serine/threonine protein kinase